MSLAVAIQMDPIETINIDADSTFVLAEEAQRRGHRLYHYLPRDLWFSGGKVMARARPLQVRRDYGRHHSFGEPEILDLGTMDVVLMRQDPPFDLGYITVTHLLEHIHPKTLVVNDPANVRNAPEKLFVLRFPELMPPTLVARDRGAIDAFRAEHRDVIVKPLYGNGGAGVFRLKEGDGNLGALLEVFGALGPEPLMVQRYIPEIVDGDKRIILVDGEAAGAVLRVPAQGEVRANLHVGGKAVKTLLTPRDRAICERIGPVLKALGLIFVGIDVIGDYLTEINVTSPTGLQEIHRLDGIRIEERIWDAIEARR